MRLRFELIATTVAALLVTAVVCAQPEQPATAGELFARETVRKALDKVANDPNVAPERTVRALRWVQSEPPSANESWWFAWINSVARWSRGLFAWFAESGRYVVWVLGAVLAAFAAVYIAQLVRRRGLPRAPQRFVAPSHVRDLDIRPESLPDDIGAAALALWERGEQRAALALLYRGLLSRLVHVHAVPIRASATEGECLALARSRLVAASAAYAARLVGTWSAAVYGGLAPAPGGVQALCADFHAALDRVQAAA